MATPVIGIAPLLTPQTVDALAAELEGTQFQEVASSLRGLLPFVRGAVEKCFVPLTSPKHKGKFDIRFARLSAIFEPYRVYLNLRLVSAFANQDFVAKYEEILDNILGSHLNGAREMRISPELISAAVFDYLMIMRFTVSVARTAQIQNSGELTVGQFEGIVEWFHRATRLDYALTAIFLVLERSIPTPTKADTRGLLLSCKRALVAFAESTVVVMPGEAMTRIVRDLKTPRIEVEQLKDYVEIQSLNLVQAFPEKLRFGSSRRQTEMVWLASTKDLSDKFGGKWIVLEKNELIASDSEYSRAREVALKKGIKRPFIIFVPSKETGGGFMGL